MRDSSAALLPNGPSSSEIASAAGYFCHGFATALKWTACPISRSASARKNAEVLRKVRGMNAAVQLAPPVAEPLSWAEICERYPDQFVCLVDIEHPELGSPEITTARVVGHGATRALAFAPFGQLRSNYRVHAVRFTGVCTMPLIRPALILDDDDLEILAEPLILDEKTLDFFRS